ncbi:MAG: TIGR01897 family CRISPR-associated protein [Aquificae bacterium]|nr:TIGR01897 family CRISPR-associated protein [Aquificota bacterium]
MKLLIASWGEPWNWNEVSYLINSKEVKSKSSVKAIAEAEKVDRTLVFIQESLLAVNRTDKITYPDPMDTIMRLGFSTNVYFNLLDMLKKAIVEFVKEEIKLPTDFEIIVAPSIGQFPYKDEKGIYKTGIWELAETLRNTANIVTFYQSFVLINILKHLISLSPDTIYIDITHGLNYAPLALYKGTIDAARIWSILTNKELIIKVFNSTPYKNGVSNLSIYLVEKIIISPKKAIADLYYEYSKIENKKEINPIVTTEERIEEVIKEFLSQLKELVYIGKYSSSSAFFGFPLLLLQAGYETNTFTSNKTLIQCIIKNLIELLIRYFPQVRINLNYNKNKTFIITHLFAYDLLKLKTLLFLISICAYTRKLWELAGKPEPDRQVSNAIIATIDQLYKVADWIVKPLNFITLHELRQISEEGERNFYKAFREKNDECKTHCTTIRLWPQNIPPDCYLDKKDERNFIAHSGILENLVEIVCFEKKAALRYRKACIEKVKELSIELTNLLKGE